MSFKESLGDNSGKSEGLPLSWHNLINMACPKCGDEIQLFTHVDMYKCVCGFKIGSKKFDEVVQNMYNGTGTSSGWLYGNDNDETPF